MVFVVGGLVLERTVQSKATVESASIASVGEHHKINMFGDHTMQRSS